MRNKSNSLVAALLIAGVLTGCSRTDQSSRAEALKAEAEDVRRVLGLDCRNLPVDAESMRIAFVRENNGFDVFNANGMFVEVSPVDFGPNIDDSVSMALNDEWDCGGIVHDRSEIDSPYSESDDSAPESSSAIEDTPTPESTDMNPPIVSEPTPQDPHQNLDNAYGSAALNIGYQAFSRSGLIDELVSQRYPRALATKAVDKLNEDWNAQARWKAGYILSINEVSKTELVKQLVAAGFTAAQAAYGADNPSLTKPDH